MLLGQGHSQGRDSPHLPQAEDLAGRQLFPCHLEEDSSGRTASPLDAGVLDHLWRDGLHVTVGVWDKQRYQVQVHRPLGLSLADTSGKHQNAAEDTA